MLLYNGVIAFSRFEWALMSVFWDGLMWGVDDAGFAFKVHSMTIVHSAALVRMKSLHLGLN